MICKCVLACQLSASALNRRLPATTLLVRKPFWWSSTPPISPDFDEDPYGLCPVPQRGERVVLRAISTDS